MLSFILFSSYYHYNKILSLLRKICKIHPFHIGSKIVYLFFHRLENTATVFSNVTANLLTEVVVEMFSVLGCI